MSLLRINQRKNIGRKCWLFLIHFLLIPGTSLAQSTKENSEQATDPAPSEEFWMYMAEFSDDDEWVDPEMLEKLEKIQSPKNSEESL